MSAPAAQPPPQDPGQQQGTGPPGANGQAPPLRLTTARWRNRGRRVRDPFPKGGEPLYTTRWSKVLAHTGPYEQFAYGRDHPSTWSARGGRDEGPLQKCLICSPQSGLIAVDVDHEHGYTWPGWAGDAEHPGYLAEYEPGYLDTRTARLIGRQHALTTRGQGYHILLDCRGIPPENWPRQVPIAGADIKSKGFIPVPGCEHYSGERYELTDFGRYGRGYVTGTPELIEVIKADQADEREHGREQNGSGGGGGGGGGNGSGHDTEVAGSVLSNVLRGLSKEQCYAEWLKIAIPRDPSWPFTADDFEQRHYATAVRKAKQIRAADLEAWADLMAWRAS
jgi:hypothetical protein